MLECPGFHSTGYNTNSILSIKLHEYVEFEFKRVRINRLKVNLQTAAISLWDSIQYRTH